MNTRNYRQTTVAVVVFFLIFLLIIFLNAYPNYYAFTHTPLGFKFSGQASWFDPWDINVYVAAIRSGSTNGLLLFNAYTTTLHRPVLLYPVYTLAGFLFPTSNPFLVFHVLAIFTTFIFVTGLLLLIRFFIQNNKLSLLALFLISLGGGMGWLFFPAVKSADLFMTGFTFATRFQRPHESLGILFYLFSLILFYLGVDRNNRRFTLLSLGSLIITILFYPYYLLSYGFICSIYLLRKCQKNIQDKRYFVYLFFNLLASSPIVIAYYYHLRSSQGFTGVLSQQLKTPNPINIALGYGLLFPLVIITIRKWNKNNHNIFLSSWLVSSLVLAFFPIGFARFYLRTLFFPIVLLVLLNIKQICRISKLPDSILILALILVIPMSSFYMANKRIDEITKGNHWYYLTESEYNALVFLRNNSPKRAGVLSLYALGNYIPAYTYNRVYFGHFLQTPDSSNKLHKIMDFYANKYSNHEARKFLEKENISYVVFGREERKITKTFGKTEFLQYSFLKPVFNERTITVFSFVN